MRVRSGGGVLAAVALAAGCWCLSCDPGTTEETASGGTGATSGAGGGGAGGGADTNAGAGGQGGSLFSPPVCDDPTDSDGDFIADQLEPGDTDLDGTPDEYDTDSDGDGIPDSVEAVDPKLGTNPGGVRNETCDPLADTDGDKIPDVRDADADGDGVPDAEEQAYDPDGSLGCWRLLDCDGDGIIDLIENAVGTSPTDASDVPTDPGLFFVLPYLAGERTKDFTFSTGIVKADIYLLLDTTSSMQATIDDLKGSIDTEIVPKILSGDATASPPVPAMSDAWIGVGTFNDVPWGPAGEPYGEIVSTVDGPKPDDVYRHRFVINGATVPGDVAPPLFDAGASKAPQNVHDILGILEARGGGDAPDSATQALWMAATNAPYAATGGGIWEPNVAWGPHPVTCSEPGSLGVPCFRPDAVPLFVLVTDAPFHNGPVVDNDYDPTYVQGDKTYADAVDALNAIHAKVIGIPVATGTPGAARTDMVELANATASLYSEPWGDSPLVAQDDVPSGEVSDEVVNLIGKLASAGLKDATTKDTNYDCPGGVDCTGDGVADLEFHNPALPPGSGPYDATQLITKIETVESPDVPPPYESRSETTFSGVRGDASVTFRVHAKNETLNPPSLLLLRAFIRAQTPEGQSLGGKAGAQVVYFVIPSFWRPGPGP